ncbi:Fur family peroxide stress response transcriptional regulator [Aneurinibacillus soli]|uniref:Peroxide-responsive repressor PerR n=1 Tax=Aneurinibacillus soli TaxID=1500254 RepID=A0A0U5B6P1_9BACL|nr:Fur family transcriptional regulator [Aneurinibacillus soli]PYE58771.1 Fur family peroxide stress response transcriptional regulator [Aneurinibacillus soli]BAU26636.1 Peroxide-responsive repressor PerR [Aneurinibacillus soli]
MRQNIIDIVIARIKERGGRVTVQRLAIINVLLRLDHPTAEEIYQFMQDDFPTLSFTTVYNTLKSLKELDVVHEHYQDERSRFEITEEAHHHFHCLRCDKLIDIPGDQVSVKTASDIEEQYGVLETRVMLEGTCPTCLVKETDKP